MLQKIEIENFLSFRDRQVVDLRISAKVPDPFERFLPAFPGSVTRVPKVVALFGANASGKTNVLKALNFLIQFIRNPQVRALHSVMVERFNDEGSKNRPIHLALELAGLMDPTAETIERARVGDAVVYGTYRYELSLNVREGLITGVSHESLRQRPNDRGKWQRLFERDATGAVLGSKAFPIKGYRHLLNTLDPFGSIIAGFSQFNHPCAIYLKKAADRAFFVFEPAPHLVDGPLIKFLGETPQVLANLNEYLNRFDFGIDKMRVEVVPNGSIARFRHRQLDVEMPWELESHGTRSFIRLYPLLADALGGGGVVIVDELDIAIHPLILPEIVRWFHDPGRNPFGAQLWFTGQSPSILDELTPEEVLFCEKDRAGSTSVYLASGIARRDDNLQRKYLSGVYGAVPQIG